MTWGLLIETSTEQGLVALLRDGEVAGETLLPFGYSTSTHLMPLTAGLLDEHALQIKDLTYIVAGVGPGSYTGIRVGVAAAKTFAYACQLPLVAVTALAGFIPEENGAFSAIIDAKVSGAYVMTGKKEAGEVQHTSEPFICALDDLGEKLQGVERLVTPRSELLRPKIEAIYPDAPWKWSDRPPDAKVLSALAHEKFEEGDFGFEILYLRRTEAEEKRARQSR